MLVDNAHGAYLRFLPESAHPMDLGADLCCDSAHKTLPVVTGGAYLHISPQAPEEMGENALRALALFGSTSPSYLILQSLDRANAYLDGDYRQRLAAFLPRVEKLKEKLRGLGYELVGTEPLKITLAPKSRGWRGTELGAELARRGLVCEFADPDFLVLMLTPELPEETMEAVAAALEEIPARTPIGERPPRVIPGELAMTPAEAVRSPWETLPIENCLGRILASPSVGCPPAVPIGVCGERLGRQALDCFAYYGIRECTVVAETKK